MSDDNRTLIVGLFIAATVILGCMYLVTSCAEKTEYYEVTRPKVEKP
jgi:hypothetical protein